MMLKIIPILQIFELFKKNSGVLAIFATFSNYYFYIDKSNFRCYIDSRYKNTKRIKNGKRYYN